jgi:hypothetical protein
MSPVIDRLLAVLACTTALFACSQRSPAPPPASSDAPSTSASAAPKVEPPGACLPKDVASSPLAHVEVSGGLATVCVSAGEGAASHPCVQVDTKATRVTAAKPWTAPPSGDERAPATTWSVKTVNDDLEVCKAGDPKCFTINPKYKSPKRMTEASGNEAVPAAVSVDGARLVAIDGETRSGGDPSSPADLVVFVDTFDVKTGKRRTHVDITSTEKRRHVFFDRSDSWRVSWVGERVRLSGYRCCGPDGAEELLDPTTGASLWLGTPAAFMALDGSTWLLAQEGASGQLKLVDVAAAKPIAELTIPGRPAAADLEAPSLDAKRVDAGHVFVTFVNPPGVAVLDVASRSLSTPLLLPLCP